LVSKGEVTKSTKLYNEVLHKFVLCTTYYSGNKNKKVLTKSMRSAKVLTEISKGKKRIERPTNIRKDNIKSGFR
jgi:hypothetical protein